MTTKQHYIISVLAPMLLTATVLYAEPEVADSDALSGQSLSELQQALVDSRVELESREQSNKVLLERSKELEADITRLHEQLSQQQKAAVAAPQESQSATEQGNPVPQE